MCLLSCVYCLIFHCKRLNFCCDKKVSKHIFNNVAAISLCQNSYCLVREKPSFNKNVMTKLMILHVIEQGQLYNSKYLRKVFEDNSIQLTTLISPQENIENELRNRYLQFTRMQYTYQTRGSHKVLGILADFNPRTYSI